MALQNPSNLYSANNVVLDNTPFVRMAMQNKARKQAREEAATQYFSKLPEKLNVAGVRTQDMQDPNGNGGIQEDIDRWIQNGIINKSEIAKGGMAQQRHLSDFQQIRHKIDRSKNRGKFGLQMGQNSLKPGGWKPRDSDMKVIEANNKSIYDPSSYKEDGVSEYDLNDLSLSAAPYDSNKQQQFDKSVLAGMKPMRDGDYKLDSQGQKVVYTEKFRPKDVFNAAQRAAQSVESDRTMLYHFEDLLHDEGAVKTASEALSQLSGTPVIAETPQQLAAGLKAHELMNFAQEKEEKDVAAANRYKEAEKTLKFKRDLQKMGVSDDFIRGRMRLGDELKRSYTRFKTALSAGEEDKILNTFIDTMAETGQASPYATSKGQVFRNGKLVQVPKEIVTKYTLNKDYENEDVPKSFYLTEDKKFIIPLYPKKDKEGKDGKIITTNGKWQLDPEKSTPIPIQNFKLDLSKLLLTKSKTGGEVTDQFSGDDDSQSFEMTTSTTERKPTTKTFKIINPTTGAVVMEGVDEETAKKAQAKGYKYQ